MLKSKKIAILGATSHIAKGLIYNFNRKETNKLFLFARSIDRLREFLKSIECGETFHLKRFDELNIERYDVIINCIGMSSALDFKERVSSYFRLTEQFDNLVLDYINDHSDTLYINFSSGAAYGTDFRVPVDESTYSRWDINHISEADYYGIAKLNSEVKHRALKDLNIVDLRVFGYFSRFIDLKSRFLLTEIISCTKENKEFITGPDNIVRDYVHPKDLFELLDKCIERHRLNDVFDVYSLKPVSKFEIIEYFQKEYGLEYIINNGFISSSATGSKENYYSISKRAGKISYSPQFTSLDSIVQETAAMF